MTQKNKLIGRWLWLTVFLVLIDQASKYWVTQTFSIGEVKPILSFFSLTLAYNQGAAFSFLNQYGIVAVWIFSVIAVIASIAIIIWLVRLPKEKKLQSVALSLVLGGALGNLIDRLVHQHVIDFIVLHYLRWSWPAFNVADSAITVGAVLLVFSFAFQS